MKGNLKDYSISESGNYFWKPSKFNIDMETGDILGQVDFDPIPVTQELLDLWNRLRGA